MLQLFGSKLRLDFLVWIIHLGWGVEPKALHPLTSQLELQPSHILLRVVVLTVSGGKQCAIGIIGFLSRLERLIVEPGLHCSATKGIAGRMEPLAIECPLGLAWSDESMQLVGCSRKGRRIAALPIDMNVDSGELGGIEGDGSGNTRLILVGQQVLPYPGKGRFTRSCWSIGMGVEEKRTEFEIDSRTVGNVFAQQLHTEILRLEQEGIDGVTAAHWCRYDEQAIHLL
jgi:hypothetical protein